MTPDAITEASVEALQLQSLFPPEVILRSAVIRDHFASLPESERTCVIRAVEKRRAEFSTGRFLAADGLRQLGVDTFPVERGAHNEPLWPAGIVGSISHGCGICVVALARSDVTQFIGVDVESVTADVTSVRELVMTKQEHPATAPDEQVRITFCAKEAVYKAIFPQVRRFVDFTEVALHFDPASGSFAARSDDERLDRILRRGRGRFVTLESVLISGFFCDPSHRNEHATCVSSLREA
jgi:4'-phosphopantetheinyl transferase EntD